MAALRLARQDRAALLVLLRMVRQEIVRRDRERGRGRMERWPGDAGEGLMFDGMTMRELEDLGEHPDLVEAERPVIPDAWKPFAARRK